MVLSLLPVKARRPSLAKVTPEGVQLMNLTDMRARVQRLAKL